RDWINYADAAHDLGIRGYEIQKGMSGEGASVSAAARVAEKSTDAYVNIMPTVAEAGVGVLVAAGSREIAEHAPGLVVRFFGKGGAKNFTKELGISGNLARTHFILFPTPSPFR